MSKRSNGDSCSFEKESRWRRAETRADPKDFSVDVTETAAGDRNGLGRNEIKGTERKNTMEQFELNATQTPEVEAAVTVEDVVEEEQNVLICMTVKY
jgi:hypothetical protein